MILSKNSIGFSLGLFEGPEIPLATSQDFFLTELVAPFQSQMSLHIPEAFLPAFAGIKERTGARPFCSRRFGLLNPFQNLDDPGDRPGPLGGLR